MRLLLDENLAGSDAKYISPEDRAKAAREQFFRPEEEQFIEEQSQETEESDEAKVNSANEEEEDAAKKRREELIQKAQKNAGKKQDTRRDDSIDPNGNPTQYSNRVNQSALQKAKDSRQKTNKFQDASSGVDKKLPGSKTPSAATPGAAGSKLPGAGGAGAKGKGGIDPNAVKDVADQARQGNYKGAAKQAVQVAAAAGLDKAMLWCIDALIPSFGLTLILMNIIMVVAFFTGAKIALWQKLLTLALDAVIVGIIALFIIIVIVVIYGACEYAGLNQGGVVAAAASGVLTVVDWWNGNEYGSAFVGVCNALGSVAK